MSRTITLPESCTRKDCPIYKHPCWAFLNWKRNPEHCINMIKNLTSEEKTTRVETKTSEFFPKEMKQLAIDLQKAVGDLYLGTPFQDERYARVTTKSIHRLKAIEREFRKYMVNELGLFWESEYFENKKRGQNEIQNDIR